MSVAYDEMVKIERLEKKIQKDRLWILGAVFVFAAGQLVPVELVRWFLCLASLIFGIMIYLEYRDSIKYYNEYHQAGVSAFRAKHQLPMRSWERANFAGEDWEPELDQMPEEPEEVDTLIQNQVKKSSVSVVQEKKPTKEFIVYLYTQGTDVNRKIKGEDSIEKNTPFSDAGEMLRELARSGWIDGRDGSKKLSGYLLGEMEDCLRAHGYST